MTNLLLNEIVFELDSSNKNLIAMPEGIAEDLLQIMAEFLSSGYFINNGLCINRFLDIDKTIDIEKLELAVYLAIKYMEKSVKSERPIYIFLRNMDKYFEGRGINLQNIAKIKEESTFILGFCQSVADEESSTEIVIQFAPTEE